MIRKNTPKNTTLITLILFSILFFAKSSMRAQTIVPQPLDGLEKLCAGPAFNEFYATFSYVNFPAGTTFTVELLDNANNPIATTLLGTPVDISPTQQTLKFSVPVNLTGSDNYGLRVKSSTGATSIRFKNSLGVTSFPVYYKDYESKFSINGKATNATICAGGTLTLSIDNDTPAIKDSSPVNYANLKYRWYKDATIISGQSDKTLVVNAIGEYYAVIEYGACTEPNINSNIIAVASSSSGSAAIISSSLGNPFCATADGTVLTATSGNKYVWKKDGKDFGANTRTVKATESGIYTVQIDFGGCNATATIDLKSNSFTASLDSADEFKLDEGETLNVSVTTDAVTPKFEWFLNGASIPGADKSSYLVSSKGTYKVVISQISGCVATKELTFKVTGPSAPATVIPNVISLSSYPYWDLPDVYQNPNTNVLILSSQGEIVFQGVDYDSSKWVIKDFKNVNPVYYYVIKGDAGEKKGSITVIR